MAKYKNLYIGVDGGLDGALVVIEQEKIVDSCIMPTIRSSKNKREFDLNRLVEFLKKYPDSTVIVEKAHAMPQLGTVQAFNFGRSFGMLLGILSALKMRYHVVHARRWQKDILTDINTKDTKQASIIVAKRLYPTESFLASARSKKPHNGLTDATLLAEYGRRFNL